ncbi:protein DpdE [Actinoplanes sp. NPDC051513]|uniref:protein DpdE n=1 Tax=Actinoplanes sp. NPDC051513 TaxID=3363908 RepID=UPI00379F0D60
MATEDGNLAIPYAGRASHLFRYGDFVLHPRIPGIARVAEVDGVRLRVECFDSVSRPVALDRWVLAAACSPCVLARETRVFWADPDTAEWRAGRVVGNDGSEYFVRLPNTEFDLRVPEEQLRVRWDRPVTDPVDVLIAGGNETGYFRDARLPFLQDLIAQRGACAGISALLSSAVEIYPHQVGAALTILGDPVQRYLLADEVGLGKTIQAGYVIRQVLTDDPAARVAVIAPDTLRRQWQRELRERFFVDDFTQAVLRIGAHETPERWADYRGFDLMIVDEAHRLVEVADPNSSPYAELVSVAHSIPRVLLLSATPVVWHERAYLALLHLLDPDVYRWDDLAGFTSRVESRMALATAVFSMDSTFEQLLSTAIEEITALIPEDPRFRQLADSVLELLDGAGDLVDQSRRPELAVRIDGLRAHIGETYRLHRRVIRNRRQSVLRESDAGATLPFSVTGRRQPVILSVNDPAAEIGHDLLLAWQSLIAKNLLDRGDEGNAGLYGAALGVLASRAGGSSVDLSNALRLRWNGDLDSAARAGLTAEEQEVLLAAPLVNGETELEVRASGGEDTRGDAAMARLLHAVARKHHHVVAFCGPGLLAERLTGVLREIGGLRVAEHTHAAGAEKCETQVRSWTDDGGILVADDSAEDGLNLQIADAVVHCRLPRSPNRLEQRLGRVDRYSSSGNRPAQQIIVSSPAGEFTFLGAWTELLVDGFGIFIESVSTLQAGIERVLPELWRNGIVDGPRGLVAAVDRVRAALADERRDIDTVDMLDTIYESTSGLRDIANAIGELEVDWRKMQRALSTYAGDSPGGLRLSVQESSPMSMVRYGRGPIPPLMPPRLLARSGIVGQQTTAGAFNRSVALRMPGTRLFRIGNPFVDLLGDVIGIDDRGHATAYWRRHSAVAQAFFGFDYLIEVDTSSAIEVVGGGAHSTRALRRQADRLLAPFIVRVWVHAAGGVVSDARLIETLDQPYSQRRDLNINYHRAPVLLDHFGGPRQYAASARAADAAARDYVLASADLVARCSDASAAATRSLAIARAQAHARKAAGRLLSDTESMLADIDVAARLTEALRTPVVRVVSVTCCIVGQMPAGVSAG